MLRCKWQYQGYLFQIHQILKKVVQKLQSEIFVTQASVAAVLLGQLSTFWGVLF